MDQMKTDKDFVENLKSINLLNSKIESEEKKLILTIKVKGESITNLISEFKILEKERVWLKTFKYEDFKEYKAKMGFESSWKIFFKSLEDAINKIGGGDMSIKFPKNIKLYSGIKHNNNFNEQDKEKYSLNSANLVLTIFHPISEDLKVKSDIVFQQFYSHGSEEYRNLNFEVVLELHESKEFNLIREKEKAQESFKNVSNNMNSMAKGLSLNENGNNENRTKSKLELKKNIKRKFHSDLINPNIKKRRAKGVKFVEDLDDGINGQENE